MSLQIYNTQSRSKETFIPLEPGQVKMYCCGVTVYDYCHLGHARSYIAWDVVRRYLEWLGYTVKYVQNFTDIDDKILNRAQAENSSMEAVSERFIQAYYEDLRRLNVRDADAYPRATENITEIYQLIQQLEKKGYAYASNGDVFYSVEKFPEYGKLSGRKQDQLLAGASGRVSASEGEKKHSSDFALWKAAKPGEPAWESPWGEGRPGWHIECSAMVRRLLGSTIDIHGGGGDLVFPHHENEIAQSEAANCEPLARFWMHNGMVTVGGEKMSKSLGNFTTIRQLLEQVDPMAIRLFVLQAHYRKPLDFTSEAIASAENGWNTFKEGLLFKSQFAEKLGWVVNSNTTESINDDDKSKKPIFPALVFFAICRILYQNTRESWIFVVDKLRGRSTVKKKYSQLDKNAVERFQTAMDDDFNTSGGLAVLFELAKELRKEGNVITHEGKTETPLEDIQQTWWTLVQLSKVLGLEVQTEDTQTDAVSGLSDAEIETLVQKRLDARQAKNYAESDQIRDRLKEAGITLIDRPGGETVWHR
ncbi:cysteine--tRNA ligase [Limnoraphis robusta Tam1]|uniref:Cysteine--tRNA ligase n=1 Tax=Limnoraphis robusta CCNP1315 TaxID=3110306 RepID=A0ABU5TTU7_9CYAN|nr:cysteine--tRNA ligase [Limnoraphis robusta]MEA5498766.1 cysteine--tRNA ligase [Limnoraphis robusta BA-68 BA1]MEA5518332.1 cysteine--tRNA ligase [Limnoraphis robusta CCNP1315]MEA5542873.1 cysteine--tRNA ligase [Limnoraphis robusta Tam1]MEA5547713.1 cysteine--tRNA ligase [Limnoraphis robusta CCNP1324]